MIDRTISRSIVRRNIQYFDMTKNKEIAVVVYPVFFIVVFIKSIIPMMILTDLKDLIL